MIRRIIKLSKNCLLNRPINILLILLFILFFNNIFKFIKEKYKKNETLIIVCTPTNKKITRLADLTRLSQTLMHIKNLHWIIIEDGNQTYSAVENIFIRSKIKYNYLYAETPKLNFDIKKAGWEQRNKALEFIRKNYSNFNGNAVVYFADDDNTYDLRLFNNYIRNVKNIGLWGVGLVGRALVETPVVIKKKITSFKVVFGPDRTFATDMAGFAVNLKLILNNSNEMFKNSCERFNAEDCFLKQFNIPLNEVQAFGFDTYPREILVWHTKTNHSGGGGDGDNYGYLVIS